MLEQFATVHFHGQFARGGDDLTHGAATDRPGLGVDDLGETPGGGKLTVKVEDQILTEPRVGPEARIGGVGLKRNPRYLEPGSGRAHLIVAAI